MEASIVDLRYKMKDVLKALERKERVIIRSHGKVKGLIIPVDTAIKGSKVKDHSFFGMTGKKRESVLDELEKLRGGRFK